MGVGRPSDLLDFADVYASTYGSDASGGSAELVTVQVRDAGEDDGDDADDVELWGSAPMVYRPAAPTGEGKCQVLVADMGGQKVGIATRDLRASTAAGALNEGDAAFVCPTAKNSLRMGADNSISLLQQGDSADAIFQIMPDGTFVMSNAYGHFEIGPSGILLTLPTGECFNLQPGAAQIIAPQAFVRAGVVGLGPAGGTVPLTFAAPSGVATPAPYILV